MALRTLRRMIRRSSLPSADPARDHPLPRSLAYTCSPRSSRLELPVGCDSLDEASWLLDAIDPDKLIDALATSSRIDLTSVCEVDNARQARRMSVTSTASDREMMASLSLHSSGLVSPTGCVREADCLSLEPGAQMPRLAISQASLSLDEQSLADIAFEFFVSLCGSKASPDLVQSMRGQLEMGERLGNDLGKIVRKASKSSLLDIRTHLKLLELVCPADFQNFRTYMAWRSGTSSLVQESMVQAVTSSWDGSRDAERPERTAHYLLSRMKGAFRRLDCREADDYDGMDKKEAVEALMGVCDEIASRCHGGREGIRIPWDLRISIAEVLLRGSFDSFDAGSLIDEADELDRLLASKVWPVLGITDDIHVALQIWAHYRNFYVSKEISLLERAIEIVSRHHGSAGTNKTNGARSGRAVEPSLPEGQGESSRLVESIMAGVRAECVRVLSDYRFLCKSPREVSAIIRLLVAVDTVSGKGEALQDTLAGLIRASVTESFERKAEELRKQEATDHNIVALLSTACLELLQSECEEYSPMLRHYIPSSTGLAALALHEACGAHLLPWVISIRALDKHIIDSLATAISLEDQLLLEMRVFGLDEGVAPWGVLGRITPLLYEWTNGQLDTLEQWSQRIISSETWNTGSGDPSISGDVKCGASMGEILKASNDVVESLLAMGIPIPAGVVRSMVDGVDAILQRYCESIVAPLQGVDEIFPPQPPLTRYKKDVVDTAQEIDHSVPKQTTPEKSPGSKSLKNITAKVGSVFTSNWLPALTADQRDRILNISYTNLSLRANSLRGVAQGMSLMQDIVVEKWESGQPPSDGPRNETPADWATGMFSGVVERAASSIEIVLHFVSFKLICGHLREEIFSNLWRFSVAVQRINPILLEVDSCLGQMCQILAPDMTSQLAYHICRALNAAVAHVLLDGGPVRWFSLSDVADLKEDMESMAYMFYADGEGIPQEEIESIMRSSLDIVQLMDEDTGALVALLRNSSNLARRGLSEDTVVRVLCHRKDHAASKFLKSQYKIKKTLPNIVSAAGRVSKSPSARRPSLSPR